MSRQNPLNIAIHHNRALSRGNRSDGGSGVLADARQRAQAILILGEKPAMIAHHSTGAGDQVAGTGIIAKPRPSREDLIILLCGKGIDCGPACHETLKIGSRRGDSCLLQHDFGKPDAVWPGQVMRG